MDAAEVGSGRRARQRAHPAAPRWSGPRSAGAATNTSAARLPRAGRRPGRHARRGPPGLAPRRLRRRPGRERGDRARRGRGPGSPTRAATRAASAAWSRAAELTTDRTPARAPSLPAGSSLAAGRPAEAERLARAALVDADDPLLRASCSLLQGAGGGNTRSIDDGIRLVQLPRPRQRPSTPPGAGAGDARGPR